MTASFTLLVLSSKDRGASSPSILYPKEESGSHCLLIFDLKPRSAGLKFGSTIYKVFLRLQFLWQILIDQVDCPAIVSTKITKEGQLVQNYPTNRIGGRNSINRRCYTESIVSNMNNQIWDYAQFLNVIAKTKISIAKFR